MKLCSASVDKAEQPSPVCLDATQAVCLPAQAQTVTSQLKTENIDVEPLTPEPADPPSPPGLRMSSLTR